MMSSSNTQCRQEAMHFYFRLQPVVNLLLPWSNTTQQVRVDQKNDAVADYLQGFWEIKLNSLPGVNI